MRLNPSGGGVAALDERLHQIVVFELREDGTSEYTTTTLRALYNRVVSNITDSCRKAHKMRRQSTRALDVGGSYGSSPPPPSSFLPSGPDATTNHRRTSPSVNTLERMSEKIDFNGTAEGLQYQRQRRMEQHPEEEQRRPLSHANPEDESTTSARAGDGQSVDLSLSPSHSVQGSKSRDPSGGTGDRVGNRRATFAGGGGDGGGGIHARERLGGYLHPRDMRRLVTPFSASNEPQLIVRRHVMLLNFDPLRAVVLRDRLLVLVPDGADSMLIALERRVRGGIAELEDQVFGSGSGVADLRPSGSGGKDDAETRERSRQNQTRAAAEGVDKNSARRINSAQHMDEFGINDDGDNDDDGGGEEWDTNWADMPFEIQSLDAVLQTVTQMLMDDARTVQGRANKVMSVLRGDTESSHAAPGDRAQERLRMHKDEVNIMENRVQGFVRAMNEVLDDDEDMALMNLGRLLTHFERFIQPVSQDILHEESDEPELILEAYLQQALSIVNGLDLLKGQISTTEEQINMTLDAIRNRLLYINTLLSVASLCVSIGSFVGSIFGMNLSNKMENEPTAFVRTTVGTLVGMFLLWIVLSWTFYKAGTPSSMWGKKKDSKGANWGKDTLYSAM